MARSGKIGGFDAPTLMLCGNFSAATPAGPPDANADSSDVSVAATNILAPPLSLPAHDVGAFTSTLDAGKPHSAEWPKFQGM